ncbi:N-6 DNA methylase [Halosquirtibacter xylanolyticus]|uniref:N-6 DNA methylase n=1 Tax=Halosquirtibacter xylanolyticus TaxID=3374599 RepID=UPI0037490828|nr:N-6 DNA methylase [Prolixibacteraceae bacterium]
MTHNRLTIEELKSWLCDSADILRGYIDSSVDIRKGGPLVAPQHKDENNNMEVYNRVIANPSFSMKEWWTPAETSIETKLDKNGKENDKAQYIDKYMRVVDIAEIKENDYNINISRYTNTSHPEEIIDLAEVRIQIADIEKREAEIDNKLQTFLKYLRVL